MSKKEFEQLLKRHQEKAAEEEINWSQQKEEWLGFIDEFYTKIESWFTPYLSNGQLSYEYRTVQITEEYIGTYDVKVMEVDFAGQKLRLEPLGTLLIGTKGRIDMEGSRGSVQFILADKNSKGMKITVSVSIDGKADNEEKGRTEPEWTWKIVLRESRTISFVEFTEENFFDALMEIVNG